MGAHQIPGAPTPTVKRPKIKAGLYHITLEPRLRTDGENRWIPIITDMLLNLKFLLEFSLIHVLGPVAQSV